MSHGIDTYDECVEWAKSYIGSQETQELWIFEDDEGKFHPVSLVEGQETFDYYAHTNKWIPRGRVFVEIKVTTMWTGGVMV